MSKRRDPNPTFDLFIPLMNDLPLKDQREVMERPFFSLQKRKRLKPIEYRSPDGEAWVKVEAMPAYGMATIWDADILIWAASVLNRMKEQGVNDLPRTLTTTTYDLLRAIRRGTGGRDYTELQAALSRLETTSIRTSLRAPKRRTEAQFGWLDGWSLEVDPATEQPRGMTITLSNWVYEGIVSERSLLTMHADYFLLTGGLERAVYRIARKHAGSQRGGWTCRVELLREKAGSDAQPKEFNRMLRKIIEADQLPEYTMTMTKTAEGARQCCSSCAARPRRPSCTPGWRPNASAMSVTRPIAAAPAKWTTLWTASRGAGRANYRGFTHRCLGNRGKLPRNPGRRVAKERQNRESAPTREQLSGFHPPFDDSNMSPGRPSNRRGFTHHSVGVSPTLLSGFHPPNHGVSPTSGMNKPLNCKA